ncbi:MAG: SUMF1/EgtB/PvdO family nonheme iron enzyme [Pseudomonadota bacterium]
MHPKLSLKGVDEAISNVKGKNLKKNLLTAIRAYYKNDSDLETIVKIPIEELIQSIWEVGDDPAEIKKKRKNLSSLKSSINHDLLDMFNAGQNPEGIKVGRDNTFVMSDEMKEHLISKFNLGAGSIEVRDPKALEEVTAPDATTQEDLLIDFPEPGKKELVQEKIRDLIDAIESETLVWEAEEIARELENLINVIKIRGDKKEEPTEEPIQEPLPEEPVIEPPIQEPEPVEPTESIEDFILEEPEPIEPLEPIEDFTFEEPIEDFVQEPIIEEPVIEPPLQELAPAEPIESIEAPILEEPIEWMAQESIEEPIQEPLSEPIIEPLEEPIEEPLQELAPAEPIEPIQEPIADAGEYNVSEDLFDSQTIVPSGVYIIGSKHFSREERPEREVELEAFYINQYPVTNAHFRLFVKSTSYITTAERRGYGEVCMGQYERIEESKTGRPMIKCSNGNIYKTIEGASWTAPFGPGSAIHDKWDHPVVQISMEDALAFADWTGHRLPTEDEWEAAARGPDARLFPWGNKWEPTYTNHTDSMISNTTQVNHYDENNKSPLSAFDMIGNIFEWTSTPYYDSLTNKRMENFYVIKGGSWASKGPLTAAKRLMKHRQSWSNTIGLRCVEKAGG